MLDLGPGLLDYYGQELIKTPHIDQLAQQGIKFNNYYGGVFCAPARWTLLTGLHDGCMCGWKHNQAGLPSRRDRGEIAEAEHDYIVVNNLFDRMGSSALIAQDGWKPIEIDRKKNHFQLYNIHDANEERIELSSQYPEITSRLKEALYWELDSALPDL